MRQEACAAACHSVKNYFQKKKETQNVPNETYNMSKACKRVEKCQERGLLHEKEREREKE